MKLRDKFLRVWLIIVGIAPILGRAMENKLLSNDLFNIWMGVTANVIGWYLILKIIFWLYDFIKKGVINEDRTK